jgi:ABC-type transport system substrate-binding protein
MSVAARGQEQPARLVGTGPFKWGQWTPGDKLTLTETSHSPVRCKI